MKEMVFTVDSALLSELGEKLVETVHVALVELVKNSNDADATEVIVKLFPRKSGGSDVHVIDNGSGMTLKQVRRYWMRIATTKKLSSKTSPIFGRPITGSKGIGRFCCRRLGRRLQLETTARLPDGKFQYTKVFFDWKTFRPGTKVTDIKCPVESGKISQAKTGTTLIISDGTDEWRKRSYEYLKRHLAVLAANRGVKRRGFLPDPGFTIRIEAPKFEETARDLREDYIDAGWGTITGQVDKRGQAICYLKAKGMKQKTITFSRRLPNLVGVNFKIGVIPDRKEQCRNPSLMSKSSLREILPRWGGVQIRYNGFRVYPYGDDDWLEIDHDRGLRKGSAKDESLLKLARRLRDVNPTRALLNLLSMRSHMGSVEVDRRARGFELKASREGFIRSDSFDDLKEFIRFVIYWATIYRDYYLRRILGDETELAREHLEKVLGEPVEAELVVESAIKYIKKESNNLIACLPVSQRGPVKRRFDKATSAILHLERASREELKHLRLIASASTLVLIFSHEVKSLLGLLSSNVGFLDMLEAKLKGKERTAVRELKRNMGETKSRFSELLEMTGRIGVDSKTATEAKLALKERAEKAARCFKLILGRYDIKLNLKGIPNNIVVGPMLEAELYAILLNVMSNSIKSVLAAGGSKIIDISATRKSAKTKILIRDTGLGLNEKYFDDVFIPFVADPGGRLYGRVRQKLNPEDDYIVGMGSGLGLSIVREIALARKGEIAFRPPEGDWKAVLEIILP